MTKDPNAKPFDPFSIQRPDRSLLTYYFIMAALTLAGFPFVILPLIFRYETLRYRFDGDGIFMSWGIIFHRQVYLTYRRIQDIHVTRNLIHRWIGLAEVAIQTAAGSARAEMTIEGIREPERLRDFLYSRMRGARGEGEGEAAAETSAVREGKGDEVLALLREIRDGLRGLREKGGPRLEGAPGEAPPSGGGAP